MWMILRCSAVGFTAGRLDSRYALSKNHRFARGTGAMTEKVFYQDSYQKTLSSQVEEVVDGGVLLAATIFYPLGGGQPGDTGTLTINDRDYHVKDTRYADDRHNIVHYLEEDDLGGISPGDVVDMAIDWERRHRLMRMHTAGRGQAHEMRRSA